jgi:ACR3 family arsenite efflux pump ArsB
MSYIVILMIFQTIYSINYDKTGTHVKMHKLLQISA